MLNYPCSHFRKRQNIKVLINYFLVTQCNSSKKLYALSTPCRQSCTLPRDHSMKTRFCSTYLVRALAANSLSAEKF